MGKITRLLAVILCLCTLFALVSCGEAEETEREVYFKRDLDLDILEGLLLEKGDALLTTDIPEDCTYLFQPVGVVPQLIYPISETVSFIILPITDGKNMLILSVKEGDSTLDYVGAEDILDYISSQKN